MSAYCCNHFLVLLQFLPVIDPPPQHMIFSTYLLYCPHQHLLFIAVFNNPSNEILLQEIVTQCTSVVLIQGNHSIKKAKIFLLNTIHNINKTGQVP